MYNQLTIGSQTFDNQEIANPQTIMNELTINWQPIAHELKTSR